MIDYYEPNSSNQKHFLYMFPGGEVKRTLRKRYPYSELFWSAFSSHFPRIFPHSDWIWSGKIGKAGKSGKNADQNNSEYGLFLRRGGQILARLSFRKKSRTQKNLEKCYRWEFLNFLSILLVQGCKKKMGWHIVIELWYIGVCFCI